MQTKPFIHPDILLEFREEEGETERLDAEAIASAAVTGKNAADEILKALFPMRQEYGVIQSHFNTERLSSERLKNFREQIISMHYQRQRLNFELSVYLKAAKEQEARLRRLKKSLFSFLMKRKISQAEIQLQDTEACLSKLEQANAESYVRLDFQFNRTGLDKQYSDLCSAFTTLQSAEKIWDVTMAMRNTETKAAAVTSIARNEVSFDFQGLEIVETSCRVLHLQNYNGGDFYLYPNFVVYFKSQAEIAIIDYADLYINYKATRFLQDGPIPGDADVVGETWYRVNKDGSPDRRFANNYKIPIVAYGELHIKTSSGINEQFQVSDWKKAQHFAEQFSNYQAKVMRFVVF